MLQLVMLKVSCFFIVLEAAVGSKGVQNFLKTGKLSLTKFQRFDILKHMADELCFVEGTLVLTNEGLKEIQLIKVGDVVFAYDELTNKTVESKVTKVFLRISDKLIKIKTSKQEITCTMEHPFLVNNKWIPARELKIGMNLKSLEGYELIINLIEYDSPNTKVYNFEVEKYHNYYVTEDKVLTHNLCFRVKWGKAIYKNSPHKTAIQHILHRHGYKSVFDSKNKWTQFYSENISKLKAVVNDAIGKAKSSHHLEVQVDVDGNINYSVRIDTNKTIGTQGETKIQVYMDKDFNVTNAYPVK